MASRSKKEVERLKSGTKEAKFGEMSSWTLTPRDDGSPTAS